MDKRILYKYAENLTFSKWQRTSYAIFNSLNRVVKICALSFAYIIVCKSIPVLSQNDTTSFKKQVDLDEVIISSTRVPVLYSESSRIVSVIKGKETELAPVTSLSDVFEFMPSVHIRQRGQNDVQGDISIRGGSFDQALVLVDGVKMNDSQTGHHNLNLPLHFQNIDRIEIINGPASRVWGPDAFSGAINIITQTPSSNKISIDLATGQNGLRESAASLQLKQNKFSHFLSGSFDKSDGYSINTDFKRHSFFYKGNYFSKVGTFHLLAAYQDKAFGAQDFYTPQYPFQFEQTRMKMVSAGYEKTGAINIKSTISWRRHHDRFELFRESDNFYAESDEGWISEEAKDTISWNSINYHCTDLITMNLNISRALPLGKISLGADYTYDHIYSNKLGEEMQDTLKAFGESDGLFTKEKQRDRLNAFAEYILIKNRFSLSGGALAHWNNDYSWGFYPGVELSYKLASDIRVFGSVNRAMRLPNYTNLYYNSPYVTNNPDLKPEKATTYEIGAKFTNQIIKASVAVFMREGKDMIAGLRSTNDEPWSFDNITDVQTKGFESSIIITPKIKLIDDIRAHYTFLEQEKESGKLTSNYMLDILKHNAFLSVRHTIMKHIGLSYTISYQQRNGKFTDYNYYSKENIPSKKYQPVTLAHAKVFYIYKQHQAYLQVNNIFDVTYSDFGVIEMPGRWIKAGVKLAFDFYKNKPH